VTRKSGLCCGSLLGLAFAFGPRATLAQDMPPDHGAAAGAPLYVQDLPVGTISVRITRPSMTEPIAGADVVGTWTTKSGGHGSATVKTGADGRAIFSEVPAGATFGAKAEIEGENLATAQFPVPAEGGTRLRSRLGGHRRDDGATGARLDRQP